MSDIRIDQINRQVLEVLSSLTRALKDPRLQHFYTLTQAEVTRDYRHARVFVSVMGNADESKAVMSGLKAASGYLRRELGKAVVLHYTPELTFVLDDSIAQGDKINRMLADIENKDRDGEPNHDR